LIQEYQTAEIQGHGNLVVQIVGDGNVANLAPHLPALWLTTYDAPLYADVQSLPPGSDRQPGYTVSGKEEAGLLSPSTRSLTMLGRERVWDKLTAWLDGPLPISAQIVVGGGGRGKTRLALELCAAAAAKDWLAGFIVRDELVRFRVQQAVATWGWRRPVLAVVSRLAVRHRRSARQGKLADDPGGLTAGGRAIHQSEGHMVPHRPFVLGGEQCGADLVRAEHSRRRPSGLAAASPKPQKGVPAEWPLFITDCTHARKSLPLGPRGVRIGSVGCE
jgi:hypothetical protein